MTGSEALQIVANPQLGCEHKKYSKALDIIQDALEKQIAKKCDMEQDEKDNDCYECPSCGTFVGYAVDCAEEHYQPNYCSWCGQRLDWEV